ncbi:MAG: hypothetical protein K2X66_02050 [Cyanobacteria bacterium]|nr:hypothetical protein [Cyanobacteriota bacterium]
MNIKNQAAAHITRVRVPKAPQFTSLSKQSTIVVDVPPAYRNSVDPLPGLRVGVPVDDEGRMNPAGGIKYASFLGHFDHLMKKFL